MPDNRVSEKAALFLLHFPHVPQHTFSVFSLSVTSHMLPTHTVNLNKQHLPRHRVTTIYHSPAPLSLLIFLFSLPYADFPCCPLILYLVLSTTSLWPSHTSLLVCLSHHFLTLSSHSRFVHSLSFNDLLISIL